MIWLEFFDETFWRWKTIEKTIFEMHQLSRKNKLTLKKTMLKSVWVVLGMLPNFFTNGTWDFRFISPFQYFVTMRKCQLIKWSETDIFEKHSILNGLKGIKKMVWNIRNHLWSKGNNPLFYTFHKWCYLCQSWESLGQNPIIKIPFSFVLEPCQNVNL